MPNDETKVTALIKRWYSADHWAMKRILATLFLLATLPVPSATAKPPHSKGPKISYKKRYVAKPYNKHKKQPTMKYGTPKR
jgi:hypothetical protein